MTIVLMFLKSYWKHILLVVVFTIGATLIYHSIYTRGYDTAAAECAEKMKEYEQKLDERISGLEDASNTLIVEALESRKVLKKDFNTILLSIKNKPLYTIEQGKCTPSPDLIRAYNEAITRANTP